MQADKNDDTDRRGLRGSDPRDSGRRHQPSGKLGDKLQKLAIWRIDPSEIAFSKDAREFRGGYATVSRAFLGLNSVPEISEAHPTYTGDKSLPGAGTPVAVKKMKIENEKDKERVLGLALREAEFLTKLSHENVTDIEGFVEDLSEDRVWLVFPWAVNGNLKDFVASEEWEIPERISLINDVTKGVEYLHNQDPPIYHGDLKSVNVLVNSRHRAFITDFGSARRLAKNDPSAQPEKSGNGAQGALLLETEFCEANNTITLTGNKYTLRWAAPELLIDDAPDLWSDIWALGWIFYEVMTNAIPFHDVHQGSVVIVRVIRGNLPSVTDHDRMMLIRALYSLMNACWSIDPSKRPTAEDCRKSLNWMPVIVPDPQRASKTSGSQARSPELLRQLGHMHVYQNDYISASNYYTEALGICTDTADNAGKADALLGLANIHKLQNNHRDAFPLFSEAVQLFTDIGNSQGRADALWGLAEVHRAQNEYNEALTFYSEAAEICTDLGNRPRRADALCGLADVYLLQNQYSIAAMLYIDVLEICTDFANRGGRASALWGLAEVHRAQSEYSEAFRFYSEVVQIYTDLGNRQGRADALFGLAELHRLQNEYSKAITFYSEVVQICNDVGTRHRKAGALWGLADVHRLQKQYGQAVKLLSEVLQIRIDIGDENGRAWALMCLGDVHRDEEQEEDAMKLYEQAAGIFKEIGTIQSADKALDRAARVRQILELPDVPPSHV